MPDSTAKPHRSFTVRMEQTEYLELAEMARIDGVTLTAKVNELIRLGRGAHIDLTNTVARMMRTTAIDGEKN